MRLYVATTNPGKLRDFAHAAEGHLLAGQTIDIEPLAGMEAIPAPAENESTFAANARVKAQYYARCAPGLWVLADDSGLEVDALGGAPGVCSARYAETRDDLGAGTPDERNNRLLLRELGGASEARRTARYRCALALARAELGGKGEVAATAEGTLEGRILEAARGAGGFGYDPLFLVEECGKTMAEIDMTTRLEFSHRGRALRKLLETMG